MLYNNYDNNLKFILKTNSFLFYEDFKQFLYNYNCPIYFITNSLLYIFGIEKLVIMNI